MLSMRNAILIGALAICPAMWAQAPSDVETPDEPVLFTAEAVAKTAKAVNYRSRSGATEVDFVGTSLAPAATGAANVRNRGAAVEIEATFENLPDPQDFGAEYLTNVLWAISPEGRVSNLGEVQRDRRGRAKMTVTSDLQVFGMVVTAEPYYAVRMPSDLIVLENETTERTRGRIFFIDAKYELLQRGAYESLANPLNLRVDTRETPLDIYQARNALAIARSVGAEDYAADSLKRAQASLDMANSSVITKGKEKEVITLARQAVQFAEDARALTIERQIIEREEYRRQETEAARAAAEEAARKQAEEEQARLRAEDAKAQALVAQEKAEAERLLAETRRLQEEQRRMAAELEAAKAAQVRAEAEAARQAAERERAAAQQAAAMADRQRQEADRLRQEAEESRLQAEREKAELRQRILDQLSAVLPTKDTERGLVVNMGDVLFDVGKFDLRPVAREKLARIAGTVLAFPGLRLRAEGHTDNTGSAELNQKLSYDRANAVMGYLMKEQGVAPDMISAEGFGFNQPVADNSTRDGRQANRRVELVISGEVIGAEFGRAAQ
jgi:outer membrane protein OmpA-like peptidoglycan-associated protein